MKKALWIRVLALILVVCMVTPTAAAAFGRNTGSNRGLFGFLQNLWSWVTDLFEKEEPAATEPVVTQPAMTEAPETEPAETAPPQTEPEETEPVETEPEETEPVETEPEETEPVETEPEETEPAETQEEMVLDLIEDDTTVENGEMLRAATFALRPVSADTYAVGTAVEEETDTVLKYFPVTLYDYDADTINAATDELDDDLTVREGIYFSDGSPTYSKSSSADLSAFEEGQYYIQNIRAAENNVNSWLQAHSDNKIYAVSKANATLWTLEIEGGEYYLRCTIDGKEHYLIVGTNGDSDGYTTTKTPITLSAFSNPEGVQLSQNGYYLCQWGSTTAEEFGGYNVNNDGGNGMRFYKEDGTLVAPGEVTTQITSGYEEWNRWDKASGSNDNGQKFYTGLVESTLNAHKDIVFTKPDGGIFNSDASVKKIYTNVEMPFVYENGTYTFDASENGVYFHENAEQGSTGTAASNTRLYFNQKYTQSNAGTYGDGSTTVWAPFNDSTLFTEGTMNYHFGMRATIPFSMTPNGRMKATDDDSDPIVFTFSGDDDVWVFIDGQLVGDLGGIHNRLDLEINFATNTVTYSESNAVDAVTGSYNDSDFVLKQQLFEGLITQDRVTFAASESHELTIFYLERGQGSSNSKIQFNLPMKDTVTVTKHATQSWTDDGSNDGEGSITPLTAEEQVIVDRIDFGFTLYKSADSGQTFSVVANTNYYLINASGQVLSMPSTDSNGHFYLKNGQSARFITELDADDGVTYYVVEDDVSNLGFVTPDYNFGGEAADGFTANGLSYAKGNLIPEQILDLPAENEAQNNESYHVTVKGSDQSEDSLVFICENYLDADLPNPSARPAEDKIVIDYGLPVEIDVLANDLYRGNSIELISVTGSGLTVNAETGATEGGTAPLFGTAVINNGKITYTLNTQLTDVEVLNYVIKVTGAVTNDVTGTTTTASEFAVGTVYIIPATTMYYEENFGTLVTYEGNGWQADPVTESTYTNATQEPGVVGTVGDSPYGSDVAYLNDSHDSNGTSKYAKTTDGAVRFYYTFTGTGTSFYVRTGSNTGTMRITLRKNNASGEKLQSFYRDSSYDSEGNEYNPFDKDTKYLYNIPVCSFTDLDYGTYYVEVVVAKENAKLGYKGEFWLDGIRIYEPMDAFDDDYEITESAYTSDAEANMVNVTLRNKLISEVSLVEQTEIILTVAKDEEGNDIYTEETVLDEDGNPVLDENGNPVVEQVPVMVETEVPVMITKISVATDEEGNVLYREEAVLDEDGNPVLDENGEPVVELIPLMVETEEPLVLPEWPDDGSFVLFTDNNGELKTAADYVSFGPKEEVYIYDGQRVSFSLYDWDPNTNKLYMGIKAPTGSGTVLIGGTSISIQNASDCYFDISNYATVTTDADGVKTATFTLKAAKDSLISLTNIKVTGNAEFIIIDTQEDVDIEGSEGEE